MLDPRALPRFLDLVLKLYMSDVEFRHYQNLITGFDASK